MVRKTIYRIEYNIFFRQQNWEHPEYREKYDPVVIGVTDAMNKIILDLDH